MRYIRFFIYMVLPYVFSMKGIKSEIMIPIQKENLSPMDRCLQTVISKFFTNDLLSVTVIGEIDNLNIIRDINSQVIISTSFDRMQTRFKELQVILYINDEYDDSFLKNISRTRLTKFIIVTTDTQNVQLIFKSFWDLKMVLVVVLVPNGNAIELYTYYPFRNQNCNELWKPVLINKWENDGLTERWIDFKEPSDIDLMGCTFNISFLDLPPFVLIDETGKGIEHLTGIEGNIFETIAKLLNFTPNYISRGEKEPGGFNPKLISVVSDVFNGRSIIGFGLIYPDAIRYEQLDGAAVYNFPSGASFITPRGAGKQLPKWVTVYYSEFPLMLWVYIILSIMTTSVFFQFLNLAVLNVIGYKMNKNSFLIMFSICIGQMPQIIKIWPIRLYLFFWTLFAFVLNIGYQSSMSSLLAAPDLPPEIKTVRELLDSNLPIKLPAGGMFLFKESVKGDSSAAIERAVLSRAQLGNEKNNDMILNIVRYRNVSHFQRTALLKYSSTFLKEVTGKINFVEDVFLFSYPVFLLRKYSCLTERVSQIISRLNSAGIINKWVNDVFGNHKYDDVNPLKKIDLNDIYLLIIILLGGWTLSFLIFTFELIRFHVTTLKRLKGSTEPFHQKS